MKLGERKAHGRKEGRREGDRRGGERVGLRLRGRKTHGRKEGDGRQEGSGGREKRMQLCRVNGGGCSVKGEGTGVLGWLYRVNVGQEEREDGRREREREREMKEIGVRSRRGRRYSTSKWKRRKMRNAK